jgi:hypothetical protein
VKNGRKVIRGQPSWVIANRQVELAVTEQGGHMAPVVFFRDTADPVQPYYMSPWQGKGTRTGVPVLDVLRGDFFCMPFGGGTPYRGETHPAHGESAGSRWTLGGVRVSAEVTELTLAMRTTVRPGSITKRISLVDGQNILYCSHELEGFSGRMCYSHHATLAVPENEGSLRLSTSPLRLSTVVPRNALANIGNEYYFLAPGKRFTRLDRVPTIWKDSPTADLSAHPIPRGFMDLVALYARPSMTPAWTAVVSASRRWLWFALKDPAALPQTTLWMSNGGRHAAPWNGVNRCLGVEDGRAYYTFGLSDSARKNELSSQGISTSRMLRPDRPTRITHIQGMVRTPRGFDRVKSASFLTGSVVFASWSGKVVECPVRWGFLRSGALGGESG